MRPHFQETGEPLVLTSRQLAPLTRVAWTIAAIFVIALLVPVRSSANPLEQDPAPTVPEPALRGLLTEPRALTKGMEFIGGKFGDSSAPKDGFFPRIGAMIPGAGWLAVGPGYRRHVFDDRLLLQASGAVSWRRYMLVESRAELSPIARGRVTIGVQGVWQDATQANFFGTGVASLKSQRSEYRLRGGDTTLYTAVRVGGVVVDARVGALGRPKISEPSGWNDPGYPYTALVFSDSTAPGLDRQTPFLHSDLMATRDTLNHISHPTRGNLLQFGFSNYRDRDGGEFSFRRYGMVAAGFIPLSADIWTLALRGAAIVSTTSSDSRVPFYMTPSLGSHNALRGFLDYRFHDRDAALFNVESRWALYSHVDVAVFADSGAVADTVAGLRRAEYQNSLGFGVRVHTGRTTVFRIDVARSAEGWRVLFKTSEALKFSTFARSTTVVPILP